MNEIDWYTIDIKIKNVKNPLAFIYIIIKKGNCIDEDMALLLRYFLKYHSKIALEHDLLQFSVLLKDYPLSISILKDFYSLIKKQLNLLDILKTIKKGFHKKSFWKLDINKQIIRFKEIHHQFLAIFDCAIGPIMFHLKLKTLVNSNINIDIHVNEMYNRLILLYKLFNYAFFYNNKILIVDNIEFTDMEFINQVKYMEYVFMKTNKIIINTINSFQLYESIRTQLENLLNPIPINIQIDLVQSEIECDDISFMLGIK